LKEGNARFAVDLRIHPHGDIERRTETAAHGQHPIATVLCCSDSRVPVEILFDRGIGDLFVVRVPGNACNDDEIGSIEYGVGHLHTPLCIVLGHTKCGAVSAVIECAALDGPLGRLVASIYDAADQTRRDAPHLAAPELIDAVVWTHLRRAMARLIENSPVVREAVSSGQTKLLGGVYDLETGVVKWLGE